MVKNHYIQNLDDMMKISIIKNVGKQLAILKTKPLLDKINNYAKDRNNKQLKSEIDEYFKKNNYLSNNDEKLINEIKRLLDT